MKVLCVSFEYIQVFDKFCLKYSFIEVNFRHFLIFLLIIFIDSISFTFTSCFMIFKMLIRYYFYTIRAFEFQIVQKILKELIHLFLLANFMALRTPKYQSLSNAWIFLKFRLIITFMASHTCTLFAI
jgi:hypothetical protein